MTLEIAFLLIVLAAMVVLFLTEKIPIDLTAFIGLIPLGLAKQVAVGWDSLFVRHWWRLMVERFGWNQKLGKEAPFILRFRTIQNQTRKTVQNLKSCIPLKKL